MDFLYFPSFLVQNYILQLHEVSIWTHSVSGGTDTLDDWAQQLAFILLALIAATTWTLLDRKRSNHTTLFQWTKITVRYFLGSVMLLYGLNKLFLIQMEYPKLSHFYTPLGDFTPMDLAWTFFGYSPPYEFIGGLLEFVAAVLLFFRRTTLLGLLIFLGIMSNVLMFNYFYGVAVKIFSTTLVLMGLFLLLEYMPKLIDFLLLQKSVKIEVPQLNLVTPWKKKARLIFKYGYILIGLVGLVILHFQTYSRLNDHTPIEIEGAYDVHSFQLNGKANTDYFDALRWNQVVVNRSLDGSSSSGHVSLGTTRRELASFEIDSLNQLRIVFARDSSTIFTGSHRQAGDTFVWTGQIAEDSIEMVLKRNKRELTLHERPIMLIMDAGEAENLRARK
ncbi:hypothetical protein [Flagellimonas sp.]|uniref:hypothetical protein n=1 Tax=Flagellimonas sp. TaxID=2058762 RepID=UPI003F4A1438